MTPRQFRKIRESLDLSQGAWAERLGVHRVTVAKIEAGRKPLTDTMARLAEAIQQGYRPKV